MNENTKTDNDRRILPPNMSTKIMSKFVNKHKQPTRKAFDQAIAELFDKAASIVLEIGLNGQNPAYDSDFWHAPKLGTFLETISDKTTSNFAAKMLESRESGLGKQGGHATKYDCETAKAIDRFNEAVQVASVASSGMQALMSDSYTEKVNFSMASYTSMVDQFDPNDDTDAPVDSDEEPADDEAPPAKRVKLEKPRTTDGEAGPDFALNVDTAPLAVRVRASPSKGANRTDAEDLEMPRPLTTDRKTGPDRAPKVGTMSLAERMKARTAVPFYGPKKPDPEWDALLARTSKPYGWRFGLDEDLDEDADLIEM